MIVNEKLLHQIEQGKREWEATLDAITDLICLLDENGRILRANRTIEKWQATQVQEVAGHSLSELIHPGDKNSYIEQFWQQAQPLLHAGQIAELEIEDPVLSCLFRLEARPIVQAGMSAIEQSAFAVIVIRDITLEKRYERELAQQNQVLQMLNQLSQDISATLDLDAVLNTAVQSAVTYLQASGGYIAGLDEEKIAFTHIATYQLPHLPIPLSASDIEEMLKDKGVFRELTKWLHTAQETAVIQLHEAPNKQPYLQKFAVKSILHVPLQAKGKKVGILELWESRSQRQFTPTDINLALAIGHQIATAIDNARLYQHALAANRLKSALLANVSHELRTPLGVILIHAEMMKEGIYGSTTATQQKILGETITNTRWLSHIVNDLIDRAQLETGQLQLNLREFSLASLVDAVYTQMAVLAQAKSIGLNYEISSALPDTLFGDPERIQQILLNLTSNAMKFTYEGQVHITIFQADSDFWGMRVSDTGIGIAPEAQSFIFDPFRQVDDSSTRVQGGNGLGLSIVKQLTELMQGQLFLESEMGCGSTFSILLPLARPEG